MEKKEKRKQQTQKEHKHELISPVNQEVTFNKFSKNIKGMKRVLNKRRTATPGFKRKRARLSSCSSEPLSPDDHSSNATTPTTPKVTSASSLPEQEPCTVTPSTSPNRSFRFPKESKQVHNYEGKGQVLCLKIMNYNKITRSSTKKTIDYAMFKHSTTKGCMVSELTSQNH